MIILTAWALVPGHPGFVFKTGERTPAMIVAEEGVRSGVHNVERESTPESQNEAKT